MSDRSTSPQLEQPNETPRIPGLPENSPLVDSYTHHSPLPTAPGPYLLGVDEAGRGPVLGPLVYGIAYCPIAYKTQLGEMGFADSKTLTSASRETLLETLSSDPSNLGWSVRVLSPQAISAGMLSHPPTNLNAQSQNATVLLIREVLAAGLEITEIYVDALGPSVPYQEYLSGLFPGISITVQPKADSTFPIVSAASIAAKVTRDAWMEGWIFAEAENVKNDAAAPAWLTAPRGSGYPSDPNTQAWLRSHLEPTFGFPSIVRFSWATVKVPIEKSGHEVQWIDEGQTGLMKAFASTSARDQGRSAMAKDLSLKSVGDL
ncbi:hypothetical protein DL93DRAFT_1725027 [Clavulina sp. PMI_390]|nr:hypothetical protein DL93DRAFT_1725027 [Clavulina sp. PMI_390]